MPQNPEQLEVVTKLDKFDEFELLISAAGQNFATTKPIETSNGTEEKPILEAILLERSSGGLNDTETMALAIAWVAQNLNPEGKAFLAQELVRLKELGLFKNAQEIEALTKLLGQSNENQLITEGTPKQTEQIPTAASIPDKITPPGLNPSVPEVNPDDKLEEHGPQSSIQKPVGKIRTRVTIAIATALALGAASFGLWPTEKTKKNYIQPVITATLPADSTTPEPEPIKLSTAEILSYSPSPAPKLQIPESKTPIPPAPQAKLAPSSPSRDSKHIATITAQKVAIATTRPPNSKPAPIAKPGEKESTPTFPVSTKTGPGGPQFDEANSIKQWARTGWTVKVKIRPGGKKSYTLTKDGRSVRIISPKVTAGQTTIEAEQVQ